MFLLLLRFVVTFCIFVIQITTQTIPMAIEIKRTPTLNANNASSSFLKTLKGENNKTSVSVQQIRTSIEISKQIMVAFKAKMH